jgi:hypothetical protein
MEVIMALDLSVVQEVVIDDSKALPAAQRARGRVSASFDDFSAFR